MSNLNVITVAKKLPVINREVEVDYYQTSINTVASYRFYYMYRSPRRLSFIDEENLFNYLSWISPSLSILIAAMHLSENVYFYQGPTIHKLCK